MPLSFTSFPESYWRKTAHIHPTSTLPIPEKSEVVIIGAGIVGITAAYVLAKKGVQVVVLEGNEILSGTTGHTTAKVTAQHGAIYHKLIQDWDEAIAKQYYLANQEALEQMKQFVEELNIDCFWEMKTATLYATSEQGKTILQDEQKAYERLGIPFTTSVRDEKLTIPMTHRLSMPEQAQFHPVKYLGKLLEEASKLGASFYENTRVVDYEEKESHVTIRLENDQTIEANQCIVATHFPIRDEKGLYFTRLNPQRSYAVLAKCHDLQLDSMYINVDQPVRSIRTVKDHEGNEFVLVGGEGHKTGQQQDETFSNYEALGEFAETYFDVEKIDSFWSAQDLISLDDLPYIGTVSNKTEKVWTATGFAKWGMTNGTLAAHILAALCQGEYHPYAEIFSPTRSQSKWKAVETFTKENANVAKELVKSKFERPLQSAEELASDSGGLVEVEGEKFGGYRDQQGQLHLVKPTCTHLGCDLHWNGAERSWDCPCHGSRFDYTGDVIEGPAVKPLKKKI